MKHKLPDAIYFLLKDIRHDWVRTLLTVFGMAMVIFSFFILSAFSQSLADYNQNVTLTRNLIIIQTDIIDPADAVLEESAIQAAELLPSELVSRVSPVIFRHLRINDHMIQLRAARVEDWTSVFHMELLEGQWPKELGEVAVGEGAAEAFGWKRGTQLTIYGSQFRVTAISRLPGSVFASVWMPLETAQKLFGMKHGYQLMFVQAAPGADAEELRTQIQKEPLLAGKYSVFFEDSYSRKNNQILNDIRSLMIIGSNLALLAVTFGTYNSTSLSIIERSREIGILRAVGFSHKTLVNIFGSKGIASKLDCFYYRPRLCHWIYRIPAGICTIFYFWFLYFIQNHLADNHFWFLIDQYPGDIWGMAFIAAPIKSGCKYLAKKLILVKIIYLGFKELIERWRAVFSMGLTISLPIMMFLLVNAYQTGLEIQFSKLHNNFLLAQEAGSMGELYGSRLPAELRSELQNAGSSQIAAELHTVTGTSPENAVLLRGIELENYLGIEEFQIIEGRAAATW